MEHTNNTDDEQTIKLPEDYQLPLPDHQRYTPSFDLRRISQIYFAKLKEHENQHLANVKKWRLNYHVINFILIMMDITGYLSLAILTRHFTILYCFIPILILLFLSLLAPSRKYFSILIIVGMIRIVYGVALCAVFIFIFYLGSTYVVRFQIASVIGIPSFAYFLLSMVFVYCAGRLFSILKGESFHLPNNLPIIANDIIDYPIPPAPPPPEALSFEAQLFEGTSLRTKLWENLMMHKKHLNIFDILSSDLTIDVFDTTTTTNDYSDNNNQSNNNNSKYNQLCNNNNNNENNNSDNNNNSIYDEVESDMFDNIFIEDCNPNDSSTRHILFYY